MVTLISGPGLSRGEMMGPVQCLFMHGVTGTCSPTVLV